MLGLRHYNGLLRQPAWRIRRLSQLTDTPLTNFRVVEVGPRDGLQNEKSPIPTELKGELIERLANCGFRTIEATSFVSPKWIPQMADHEKIVSGLHADPSVSYAVLVPNLAGLERLLNVQSCVAEIAVFTAASESFTQKNTNCSIEDSLHRVKEVTEKALKNGLRVRGYISTVIGCPYEGGVRPEEVARITDVLLGYGCYEISLGDTIGVGSAGSVNRLLGEVLKAAPAEKLAVHFHDTYGQALGNVLVAIERGIRVADSSVAGLGGCPYAKGATGNLASEDLVYMLHDLGFKTGIDMEKLIATSDWICNAMGKNNASKVTPAILAKRK